MRRRAFVALAGAAVTWPLLARAQQPGDRVRRLGVLMNLAADDALGQERLAAFVQGLQERGWTAGRNMQIDVRWGGGDADRYRAYAASWSRSRRMSFWPPPEQALGLAIPATLLARATR